MLLLYPSENLVPKKHALIYPGHVAKVQVNELLFFSHTALQPRRMDVYIRQNETVSLLVAGKRLRVHLG